MLSHNFHHKYDYVSLADQDDIWLDSKLISAVNAMSSFSCDCYASNLLSFNSEVGISYTYPLVKSHAQTSFDYLFQGASAGCTYVFTPKAIYGLVSLYASSNQYSLSYDWLIYAYSRSRGFKWFIDSKSYIYYRQHSNNVHGARLGFTGILSKFADLKSGWYISHVLELRNFVLLSNLEKNIFRRLSTPTFINRLYLAVNAYKFRRRPVDALTLALYFIFFFH